MALDVVTLQIRVDASQVQAATQAITALGGSAQIVEGRTNAATVSTGRLNNALLGLARQATGTSPVLARMTDVLLGMAYGGAQMTAILAGLAAVGLAYRKLTEDTRGTRQETEKYLAVLREKAQVENADAQRAIMLGRSQLAVAQQELALLRERNQVAAGGHRGRGGDDLSDEMAVVERRILLLNSYIAANVAAGVVPEGPGLGGLGSAGGIEDMVTRARGQLQRAMLTLPELSSTPGAPGPHLNVDPYGRQMGRYLRGEIMGPVDMSGLSTTTGATQGRTWVQQWARDRDIEFNVMVNRQRQLQDAEAKLASDRERANAALVTSLANVGRAYGGVTDQVLNLAAATMSIYQAGRLPGFGRGQTASRTDMAVGYGSAALSGIGFGQSTGSPILGGLGGGLSGFAMLGNPAGAIVGAVGGIVSGLMEQGRRAREAQRMWRLALEDFSLMFEEVTPQMQVNRTFEQLTGGRSAEDVRRLLATTNQAEQFRLGITSWNDALRIYDERMKKAAEVTKEQANAERELYDARFRALNAPTGFNLAYYGWGAGFGGADSPQAKGDKDVEVHVYVDGEEVATRVERKAKWNARRGGPSPYTTTAR